MLSIPNVDLFMLGTVSSSVWIEQSSDGSSGVYSISVKFWSGFAVLLGVEDELSNISVGLEEGEPRMTSDGEGLESSACLNVFESVDFGGSEMPHQAGWRVESRLLDAHSSAELSSELDSSSNAMSLPS